MVVNIGDKAQVYIKERGGIVHLYDMGTVGMCCGCMRLVPSVRLSIPDFQENYEFAVVEGIELYVPRTLSYSYPLTVEVKKLLMFFSLYINGWRPI